MIKIFDFLKVLFSYIQLMFCYVIHNTIVNSEELTDQEVNDVFKTSLKELQYFAFLQNSVNTRL